MSFRLALAQCTYAPDNDNTKMARTYFELARKAHADLIVFPEAFMGPYDEEHMRYINDPEPLEGPFATAIDSMAAEFGMWVVYTITESNPQGSLPFNTAIVTGSDGSKRGIYRKIHLFDAQGYRESDRLSAGDSITPPTHAPFGSIGLAICYDLRFPELSRAAALSGCQVMIYPSAWVSGQGKVTQWETLLRARAIENCMFVAGVSRADTGYIGNSCVFGPDGALLARGEKTPWADMPKDLIDVSSNKTTMPSDSIEHEALIVADIDLDCINAVRESTPALLHRRTDCY
ncbi:MAG: carbon-nitrogen hydrolase family protein [Eggerthellaceae bacterium]|nr:carbon-nitrogen hydrolase family protein [Eggerthellaceae bacterium]